MSAKLKGYWIKVHYFLIRRTVDIVGVNMHIHLAILSSVVECQCTEWRWGILF